MKKVIIFPAYLVKDITPSCWFQLAHYGETSSQGNIDFRPVPPRFLSFGHCVPEWNENDPKIDLYNAKTIREPTRGVILTCTN